MFTIMDKKELCELKIVQFEKEKYLNELNEKVLLATQADSSQLTFVRAEIKRCEDSIAVIQAELNTLLI